MNRRDSSYCTRSDYCLALYDVQHLSPSEQTLERLVGTVFFDPKKTPFSRVNDLRSAALILQAKSKSFAAGCVLFEGQLQLDLLALYVNGWSMVNSAGSSSHCRYAFCRVVDDMIDEPPAGTTAESNIELIARALDVIYAANVKPSPARNRDDISKLLSEFSASSRSAFHLLQSLPIKRAAIDELLDGFRTDLRMAAHARSSNGIDTPFFRSDDELGVYAEQVAASVADACCQLCWYHYTTPGKESEAQILEQASVVRDARRMGRALQLTNIARDVPADAILRRCYLPDFALSDLSTPEGSKNAIRERMRLIRIAQEEARASRPSIERLPVETRGGIRAACDVYLDIGQEVKRRLHGGEEGGRAVVGRWRRAWVAWQALRA